MSATFGFNSDETTGRDPRDDDCTTRSRSPSHDTSIELRATDYAARTGLYSESARGDVGTASLEAADEFNSSSPPPPPPPPPRERPNFIDLPLPDLQLPAPALVVPATTRTNAASARRRRQSILSSNGGSALSPSRTLSPTSPRARFDLSRTGTASPELAAPVPLRPILQNPLTPSSAAAAAAARSEVQVAHETSSIHRERSPSPVFAPREDDEPHPEHGMHHEQRTPHPLYTPAPKRRKRRKRRGNGSVASGRSSRSGKSARSRVKRALRKVQRRRRRGSMAGGGGGGSVTSGTMTSSSSSSTSSSSLTSSTSSTSSSSGRTNSTWAGWRFWRNSSSGSSSSSSDDSDSDTDSDWDPPTPHFKLLTPVLSRPTLHYPAHLFSGATPTPVLSTPTITASLPRGAASAPDQAAPVFELANSTSLAPALERLSAFWQERQQEDGIAGDLGAGIYNPSVAPLQDLSPSPPVETNRGEGGYFPPDAAELAAEACARGSGGRTPPPFAAAATPAVTPGVLGGPSTKRGREQARTARMEFRRLGKNKEMRNGPAWWLDIMCPSVADMRELRKVSPHVINPLPSPS